MKGILIAAGITAVVGWVAYRTQQLSEAKKQDEPIDKQAE